LRLGSIRSRVYLSSFSSLAVGIFFLLLSFQLTRSGRSQSYFSSPALVLSFFVLVWVAATFLLARWSVGAALERLGEIAVEAERIAQGHLYLSAAAPDQAEVGAIAASLNAMVASLGVTLGEVILSVGQMVNAGVSLDANAENLAANAAGQSERTQQLARAAGNMSQTIDAISGNATDAAATSSQAMRIAQEGRQIAEEAVRRADRVSASTAQLVATVERLDSSVQEIGGFLQVISEIADKTNLLALNAAIEAARSGEHGRGFAVVAKEVGTLAARAKDATKEIAGKIGALQMDSAKAAHAMEESSTQVEKTAAGIRQVGNALDQILDAFDSVNGQVSRMTAGIREQSATTHEVAEGIDSTSQLSAGVGEMAREAAQGVKQLRGIADHLLATLGALRMETHLQTSYAVSAIAADPELRGMDRRRQEAFLQRTAKAHPFIELLYITDANGRQITSNISAGEALTGSYGSDGYAMDWSKRPWFTGALGSHPSYVSDLYLSVATNTFCYTVACRLEDEAGRLIGVLGADIRFEI